MKRLALLWAAGAGLLAIGLIAGTTSGAATDDATNSAVNGIADMLAKGDKAGAKKAAVELSKKKDFDLDDVMHGFKPRNKKGIGVGVKAGEAMPDGIEAKIESLARDGITPPLIKKESEALTRAGFVIGAVGQIAIAATPAKDEGTKLKKDWVQWAEGMVKASDEFSVAAKSMSAAELKKAATNIKKNCDSCHMVFK
jgi:hypothetical protein